jgi:hypothetical protein
VGGGGGAQPVLQAMAPPAKASIPAPNKAVKKFFKAARIETFLMAFSPSWLFWPVISKNHTAPNLPFD